MKKKNKFGNEFKPIELVHNLVQLFIVGVFAFVLYKIVMLVKKYKGDPANVFNDFSDWLGNEVGKVLRTCGTCAPSDDEKKSDPSKTNMCGGTGIPFLNLGCLMGVGIVLFLVGSVFAGLAKLYGFVPEGVRKFFGRGGDFIGEKFSKLYKRVFGDSMETFEDKIKVQNDQYDKNINDGFEKWKSNNPEKSFDDYKAAVKDKIITELNNNKSGSGEFLKNASPDDAIAWHKLRTVGKSLTAEISTTSAANAAAAAKTGAATASAASKTVRVSEDDKAGLDAVDDDDLPDADVIIPK